MAKKKPQPIEANGPLAQDGTQRTVSISTIAREHKREARTLRRICIKHSLGYCPSPRLRLLSETEVVRLLAIPSKPGNPDFSTPKNPSILRKSKRRKSK